MRTVTFESKAKDFGFLIPTPTVPEIKDADAEVFDTLSLIVAESHRSRQSDGMVGAAASKGVDVLAVQKAAGLVATTLRADTGEALAEWMRANGYPMTEGVAAWAKPYLDKKWPMTTFKVDPDAKNDEAPTRALRMSFKADEPFYPYRGYQTGETGKSVPERRLLLYVLSSTPMVGVKGGSDWDGPSRETVPTGLTDKDLDKLAKQSGLAKGSFRGLTRLSSFTESVPAGHRTKDLTFQTDPNFAMATGAVRTFAIGGGATLAVVATVWLSLRARRPAPHPAAP